MNKKVFISHAEKDSRIVSAFVDLLYDIGLSNDDMFCSSRTDIGVPVTEDIYDYLRYQLDSDNVITIFMLSDNYYNSPACLNEMGAVWIKQQNYFTFLLPEFEFKDIKGAINPNKKGIKLDSHNSKLKGELTNFKKEIEKLFSISKSIDENRWEMQRDRFIDIIAHYSTELKVNLFNFRGYCIGETNYNGCNVDFDESTNTVHTEFNFNNTNAQVCSVVFFTGEFFALSKYEKNKKLKFLLKASGEFNVRVELRLKNQDVQYKIKTTKDWTEYEIPLKSFGGALDNWKELKEIKFLTYRKDITLETMDIKDIILT